MSVRPVRGGPTKKATGGSNHNIAIVFYIFIIEKTTSEERKRYPTSLRDCQLRRRGLDSSNFVI